MAFGNRGPSLIDYTELQRRGLIKKKDQTSLPIDPRSGMIDLTRVPINSAPHSNPASINSSEPSLSAPSPQTASEASMFSFLDNAAASTTNTSALSSPLTPSSSTPDSGEMKSLQVKMEDLEYKFERLIEKITLIESKLGDFERKVS